MILNKFGTGANLTPSAVNATKSQCLLNLDLHLELTTFYWT